MKFLNSKQAKKEVDNAGFELVYDRHARYWYIYDMDTTLSHFMGSNIFPYSEELLKSDLQVFSAEVNDRREERKFFKAPSYFKFDV